MRMHKLVLIGFTAAGLPIYSIRGGAPEDGEDGGADEGADGEEGDGDGEEGGEDEYTPPTKEQWDRAQAALKKANGESAARRKWLEEHGISPRTGKPYDSGDDDEQDDPATKPRPKPKKSGGDDEEDASQYVPAAEFAKLQKERRTEGKKAAEREARLTAALTKSAAQNALTAAGWNGNGKELVERFIDLSECEISDDGEVLGLDDQVDELKRSMPDWFKKPRAPKRQRAEANGGAREVDGADRTSTKTVEEPKSWLDRLSDQFDNLE